jgi:hypothetical protein
MPLSASSCICCWLGPADCCASAGRPVVVPKATIMARIEVRIELSSCCFPHPHKRTKRRRFPKKFRSLKSDRHTELFPRLNAAKSRSVTLVPVTGRSRAGPRREITSDLLSQSVESGDGGSGESARFAVLCDRHLDARAASSPELSDRTPFGSFAIRAVTIARWLASRYRRWKFREMTYPAGSSPRNGRNVGSTPTLIHWR